MSVKMILGGLTNWIVIDRQMECCNEPLKESVAAPIHTSQNTSFTLS